MDKAPIWSDGYNRSAGWNACPGKAALADSWANMPEAIRMRERSDTIVLEHPNERITER